MERTHRENPALNAIATTSKAGYAAVYVHVSMELSWQWETERLAEAIADFILHPSSGEHPKYDAFMNAHEGGPTPARIAIMDKMANYCFNLNGEVTNRAKLIEMHRTHNTDKAESNRDKIQNGLLPDALTTDSGSHGTAGNPYQVVRELLRNAKFEENWGDRSYNNIAVHNGSVISIYKTTRPNSPMGIAFAIVVNGRSGQ